MKEFNSKNLKDKRSIYFDFVISFKKYSKEQKIKIVVLE